MPDISLCTTGPARFDLVGRHLGNPVHILKEARPLRRAVCNRLINHARDRLEAAGFTPQPDWKIEVETTNAEARRNDRVWSVTFRTSRGGGIGVQGIMTRNGWPVLDHGLFIEDA